jgi:hypothetical protein
MKFVMTPCDYSFMRFDNLSMQLRQELHSRNLLYNQIELHKIHKTFACTPSDIFSTFWLSFVREKIGCLGFRGSVSLPYKNNDGEAVIMKLKFVVNFSFLVCLCRFLLYIYLMNIWQSDNPFYPTPSHTYVKHVEWISLWQIHTSEFQCETIKKAANLSFKQINVWNYTSLVLP